MKRTILLRTIIVMVIGAASGFVVAFSSRNTCGRRSLVTNGVGAVSRSRATGAAAGVTGIVAPQPQHPLYSATTLSLSVLTSSSNHRPGRPQQYRPSSTMSTPSSSFSSSAAASLAAAAAAASSSPASSTNDPSGSARREGVGPRQAVIEARLTQAFAPITYLEVQNTSHGAKSDESHFKVIVVSETFAGTRLIGRHRAINKAVSDADDGGSASLGFHSLEIGAAKTPDEWDANSTVKPSPKCQGTRDCIQYGIMTAMHLFSHFVIICHR